MEVPESLHLFEYPKLEEGFNRIYDDYHPISSLTGGGALEFIIPKRDHEYIDLKNIQLHVKAKIVKEDGTAITAADKVAPVNLLLHSMFNSVDLYLQGERVCQDCYYSYKAYMKTLLEAKKKHPHYLVKGGQQMT